MKRTISILFLIILLSSIVGCKKDDVKVQSFTVVSEVIFKGTTTIILTVEYSYPTVIEEVEGYISESSNMNNAVNVHGEISGKVFKLRFNDLQANTNYYYYWEYSNGVDDLTKTDVKIITTNDYGLPTVSTNDITDITATTATCGGVVIDNGGLEIIERGVCWSTNHNPTIDGAHTSDGSGIGSYISSILNLSPDTKYYICAYATNSNGTNYGEINTFIATDYPGSIASLFSVSSSKKVRFSKGNLQCRASTNTWRFAENQYDYIGGDNSNISSNYSGWIDLFGWGTSGYNHGAILYHPYDCGSGNNDYYAYGSASYNLNNQTGKADWGYNRISNGGNKENKWRTLTADEWNYVINARNTASGKRFAKATVNNIKGVILLPDNWSDSYYNLSNINMGNSGDGFINNLISSTTWYDALESHGAIFLPAAGSRFEKNVESVNIIGEYWSASVSVSNTNCAYPVYFHASQLNTNDLPRSRCRGNSVRLVCDVE